MTIREAYDELCAYTLTRGDAEFIHQQVVDAFAAQTADASTRPIKLTFGLIGLYLHLEHGFTGRQVQRAHMWLARRKQTWPTFALPQERGAMTAVDVLARPAGVERDAAIHAWCAVVWEAFRDAQPAIANLWSSYGSGFRREAAQALPPKVT